MNKKINLFLKKVWVGFTVLSLVLFSIGVPAYVEAAAQTSFRDAMSTQAKNVASDHTLTWTLATGHTTALNAVITIDFVQADFVATGTWQTTDFAFSDNVRSSSAPASVGTGAATCSGSAADNYIVNVTAATSTFVITTCTGWTTSAATTATTFVIKGATGGTGTLTNANTDTNSSLITLTDSVNDTDTVSGAAVIETNDVVTVTASVAPTLTFAISSATVALGPITSATNGTGSHTIAVATNASGGFVVTYNGATLTSGLNTIAANAGSTQAAGTEEFGINLKANTSPAAIGSNPVTNSGATCTPHADYNTADTYKFVASTTTTMTNMTSPADCTFTVAYVADVATTTEAGSYTTDITYIGSGNF